MAKNREGDKGRKGFIRLPGRTITFPGDFGIQAPIKISGSKIFEYEPIDKGPKYTSVSLSQYGHTKGLIMRVQRKAELVGYCTQDPREVLEAAFARFHLTSYRGLDLFDSGDFEKTTPLVGLSLGGIKPVYGITGGVEDLLALEELSLAARKQEPSREEVERIIEYVNRREIHAIPQSNDKQMEYLKTELTDVLKSFLG